MKKNNNYPVNTVCVCVREHNIDKKQYVNKSHEIVLIETNFVK